MQPVAGDRRCRRQPLAHLPRHLRRALLFRQGQPQHALGGSIALAELKQQVGEAGFSQSLKVVGIEGAFCSAFGRHRIG
jgi:hypothetical protein